MKYLNKSNSENFALFSYVGICIYNKKNLYFKW